MIKKCVISEPEFSRCVNGTGMRRYERQALKIAGFDLSRTIESVYVWSADEYRYMQTWKMPEPTYATPELELCGTASP